MGGCGTHALHFEPKTRKCHTKFLQDYTFQDFKMQSLWTNNMVSILKRCIFPKVAQCFSYIFFIVSIMLSVQLSINYGCWPRLVSNLIIITSFDFSHQSVFLGLGGWILQYKHTYYTYVDWVSEHQGGRQIPYKASCFLFMAVSSIYRKSDNMTFLRVHRGYRSKPTSHEYRPLSSAYYWPS